jgi:hypothetical protein
VPRLPVAMDGLWTVAWRPPTARLQPPWKSRSDFPTAAWTAAPRPPTPPTAPTTTISLISKAAQSRVSGSSMRRPSDAIPDTPTGSVWPPRVLAAVNPNRACVTTSICSWLTTLITPPRHARSVDHIGRPGVAQLRRPLTLMPACCRSCPSGIDCRPPTVAKPELYRKYPTCPVRALHSALLLADIFRTSTLLFARIANSCPGFSEYFSLGHLVPTLE